MGNTKYKISNLVYAIERDEKVLLCNTSNGSTQEIPKECYRVIKEYLPDYTVEEICEAAHDEDKDYFYEMFDYLIKKEYLCEVGKSYIKCLEIVVTNRCNLKCRHCCADAFDTQGEDKLSLDDIKKAIDSAERMKMRSIVITGGEPLIRKDFLDITDYLKNNFSGKCSLMTNGLLINENNVEKITSCYSSFNISLDGYDEETCSKLRGPGIFDKVISKIELLKKHGVPADHIAVSMVETSYTYKESDRFVQLNEKMGTRPIIREFSPIGRGEKTKDEFVIKYDQGEKMLTAKELLKRMQHEKTNIDNEEKAESKPKEMLRCRSCAAGEQSFVLNHDGNIYPCLLLDDPEYSFGSITEIASLDEYLLTEKYKQTEGFNKFNGLIPKNHEKCSECDYSPFCIYCYASFARFDGGEDFDSICQIKQMELCNIWR